jgi:hypothetical protein
MSSSSSKQNHYRFSVDVDGIALADEGVAAIDEALRKAAVMAMATLDLRGRELTFSPIMQGMIRPNGDDDGDEPGDDDGDEPGDDDGDEPGDDDGDEPPVGGAQISVRSVGGGSEIQPVLSSGTAVFGTKLAGSKVRGVAAIRVSRVGDDICFDQLGPRGQETGGFVLHLDVKRSKGERTLKAISVTRKGSKQTGSPLGKAEREDLASIVDELSQFRQEDHSEGSETIASIWGAIGAGIDCGLAAVELGANPIEDVACAIAAGEVLADSEDDD